MNLKMSSESGCFMLSGLSVKWGMSVTLVGIAGTTGLVSNHFVEEFSGLWTNCRNVEFVSRLVTLTWTGASIVVPLLATRVTWPILWLRYHQIPNRQTSCLNSIFCRIFLTRFYNPAAEYWLTSSIMYGILSKKIYKKCWGYLKKKHKLKKCSFDLRAQLLPALYWLHWAWTIACLSKVFSIIGDQCGMLTRGYTGAKTGML